MPAITNQHLYETLRELEIISSDLLDAALKKSEETQKPLSEILLDKNLISDMNLGRVMADLLSVPFVELSQKPINREILKLIPEAAAREQRIIIYSQSDGQLLVATSRPENIQFINFIQKRVGRPVSIAYATDRDISDALSHYKSQAGELLENLISQYLEEAEKLGANSNLAEEPPIIRIVDTTLRQAYRRKASDIHIEAEEDEAVVRFRIDGVLSDIFKMPPAIHSQVVTRIKVISKLRTDEHQTAQDGKLTFKFDDSTVDARVSIVPTTNGEKVVIRVLSERSRQFSLADLGFGETDLDLLKEATSQPHGMILATGPTGSGKTTTLYAMVKLLNERDINIMTIEDPVEYDLTGVNQIQVNTKTELTFAQGLRSIVRQDPDIILVGEVRDEETAQIAINSAMTGHMVLSSVHTNDAATTFPRLNDMGVEPFLIGSSVNIVIAQRLLRKLCTHCRVSTELNVRQYFTSGKNAGKGSSAFGQLLLNKDAFYKHFGESDTYRLYTGKGCSVCHDTGYKGRVGIFEVLQVTDQIREAVINRADAGTIKRIAIEQGMTSMLDDGLEKVKQGITSLDEVLRVTKD